MFKSVFTRSIAIFMIIIVISFSVLAITICSMVSGYTSETNADMVRQSAESARAYLENEYLDYQNSRSRNTKFVQFVKEKQELILSVVSMQTSVAGDSMILIADANGRYLCTNSASLSLSGKSLSESLRNDAAEDGCFLKGNLDGLLPSVCSNCILCVNDEISGKVCGYLVASCEAGRMDSLLNVIIKTVVMSTLWVLLAAMVGVYYVTEQVIGPIRSIRRAAKCFSQGQFDVRVPVRGQDEVAELSQAFNNMASSLEDLENLRSTFLANVSHDLRTPMTTISGFVDGILDGTIPPERQNHYLETISVEVKRLSRLVSSLLDLSRIQAGDRKFVFVPFDICEMGRQILISFEQKLEEKHLDVSFETTEDRMMAFADHDAIYQVFYNLCHNAVKFSREGGAYRISIKDENRKIRVTVYNEGDGIPKEDLPYVFDRFFKSDKSRGQDKTGAGLGLFIAKTIMNSHGEEIRVDSEYGSYCEFSFTLSYATNAQIDHVAEIIQEQSGS